MLFNFFERMPKAKAGSIKPVVLLAVDGFGVAPNSKGNAIYLAKTPNYDYLLKNYPHGQLIASGESVGLPANEEGNSEVGHLTMGVGRVVPQSLMRIHASIEDGSFTGNLALNAALKHVKQYQSALHIISLVSSGEVHAALEHFYATIDFYKNHDLKNICLHLITDGRDAPPQEAQKTVSEILEYIKPYPNIKVSTIAGRYYSMDRDRRWERTQLSYEAMVEGKGPHYSSPLDAIKATYQEGKSDEFILPSIIVGPDILPVGLVKDNDAAIFVNFRIDRPRQLTMAFTMKDFESSQAFEIEITNDERHFGGKQTKAKTAGKTFIRRVKPQNLFFVTMTEYQKNIPVSAIAFPPISVPDSLTSIFASHSLKQLHLAESEKERMVTYYFDGLNEKHIIGEDVVIVPSPNVKTYDLKPAMSTQKIVREFILNLNKSRYHFFVINFACTDMVGHTGKLGAAIKAVEAADKGLGQIVNATLVAGGTFLMTADHGNVEELYHFPTSSYYFTTSKGDVNTSHSNNPVPVIIVSSKLYGLAKQIPNGSLSDIAPTILHIMDIPTPDTMTGKNLLEGII